MATNCEDVSARIVELLYGELPADARPDVDAHVAGCARCRRELEGLEKTRAVARTALDDSPPPRARAEILRRAAEHLAAHKPVAAAAAAVARVAEGKAKKTIETERASFWSWLRSRWTLPSLATVGAVAVLVVASRQLLEPEKLEYRGSPEFQRSARAPAAAPPAERTPVVQPAPPPSAAAPSPVDKDEGRWQQPKTSSSSRGARHRSAATPKVAADAMSDEKRGGSGDGRLERRFAPPPPPKSASKAEQDDPMEGLDGFTGEAAKPSKPAKAGGPGASLGEGAGFGMTGKADRKPEKERAAEAPAREAAAPMARSTAPAGGGMARPAAPAAAEPAPPPATLAAPAPAPSPPPPPPASRPTPRHDAEKKASKRRPAAAADDESDAPADKASSKGKASAETAVERANRLFTEGRWAEAAAAYRELLRRDPNNSEAARWRQRLAAAEAAQEARRGEQIRDPERVPSPPR